MIRVLALWLSRPTVIDNILNLMHRWQIMHFNPLHIQNAFMQLIYAHMVPPLNEIMRIYKFVQLHVDSVKPVNSFEKQVFFILISLLCLHMRQLWRWLIKLTCNVRLSAPFLFPIKSKENYAQVPLWHARVREAYVKWAYTYAYV